MKFTPCTMSGVIHHNINAYQHKRNKNARFRATTAISDSRLNGWNLSLGSDSNANGAETILAASARFGNNNRRIY
ncbi:hypothetical protein KL918_001298 [Ogataea parapolymorpha]|nr:hypothetical protein KL918_001298 [Ogataea parapolymorpha]KAG7874563.1 hypothetical protein KL916_001329 [Ogataea parapolymorpha]